MKEQQQVIDLCYTFTHVSQSNPLQQICDREQNEADEVKTDILKNV